jgi:hypothetical protein
MLNISLFKVGLVTMLFFVMASNVLNYVSIGTNVWAKDTSSSSNLYNLWTKCTAGGQDQVPCFDTNPAALIATGTALNCLAFVLIAIAQLALCMPRFRDSFALYFVIGSLISVLLSLVFNTTGWYFVFYPQYQNLGSSSSAQPNTQLAYSLGWSFWLMAPSFGCGVIAAVIGAAILGCTCVTNKVEREKKEKLTTILQSSLTSPAGVENPNFSTTQIYFSNDANDPQVLRL